MFLSKLVLNDRLQKVHQDLANIHKLHQRIMQGFPDEAVSSPRKDWQILYRQEPNPNSNILLVQSNCEPDWSRLPEGYLIPPRQREDQVKSFDLSSWNLSPNHVFQFRIKINPVKREAQSRKLIPLYKPADHLAWFQRKAQDYSFELQSIDSIPVPHIIGKKANNSGRIKIFAVLLQGQLRVQNSERFKIAMAQGIGKGKSYGCGLLSIQRIG